MTPEQQSNKEAAERAHDAGTSFVSQFNEFADRSSQFALKSLFLVNGGALIAILTFIASLIGNADLRSAAPSVTAPMIWFAAGLGAVTAAAAFGYLTSFATLSAAAAADFRWTHPYVADSKASVRWKQFATVCHVVAIALGFFSLAAFWIGMLEVRTAIQSLPF